MKKDTVSLIIVLICFSIFLLLPAGRAPAAIDSATVVEQPQIPITMFSGEVALVTVGVYNNGDTDWTYDRGCKLIPLNPQWGPTELELDEEEVIRPGESKAFTFLASAPYRRGESMIQWQMTCDRAVFGSKTTEKLVDVDQNLVVPVNGEYEQDIIVDGLVPFEGTPPVTITFAGISDEAEGKVEQVHPYWRGYINNDTQTLYSFGFSPKYEGDWTWVITSELSEPIVSDTEGFLIADDERLETAARNIGRGANPHIFYDDSGQPFFLMGDTVWAFSTDEFSTSAFNTYVQNRGQGTTGQKFNYIHGNIYVPSCGGSCTRTNDEQEPFDSNGAPRDLYFNKVKQRVSDMNDQGIIAGISPGWAELVNCEAPSCSDNVNWDRDKIIYYYEYMVNKFRNNQVVWVVGSNVHPADDPVCTNLSYADLGNLIQSLDDANGDGTADHLITIHPSSGATTERWSGASWLTTTYMQTQECADHGSVPNARNAANLPVVNGEFNYETKELCANNARSSDCDTSNNGGCNQSTAGCECNEACKNKHHQRPEVVLHGAWQIALRGGFFVYGNTGSYNCQADEGSCRDTNTTAANYMKLLYNFFNYVPQRPEDVPVLWFDQNFAGVIAASGDNKKLVSGVPGKQYILYSETDGGSFPGSDPGSYLCRTYDITTGAWNNPLGQPADPCDPFGIVPQKDIVILANKTEITFVINCENTPLVLGPGLSYSQNCTATPVGGFRGTVNLSCDLTPGGSLCGPPLPATLNQCGMAPGQITFNNDNPVSFLLNVGFSTLPEMGDYCVVAHGDQASGSAENDYAFHITQPGTYCSNFNNGVQPGDWVFKSQWSAISDGMGTYSLQVNGSAGRAKATPPTPCSNCTIEAEFSFVDPTAQIVLFAWFQDGQNKVKVVLKDGQTDKVSIRETVNGQTHKLRPPRTYSFDTTSKYRRRLRYDPEVRQYIVNIQNVTNPAALPMEAIAFNSKWPLAKGHPFGSTSLKVKNSRAQIGYFQACYGCVPGELSVNNPSVIEPSSGPVDAGFEVTAPVPACEEIKGRYFTTNDETPGVNQATAGLDYQQITEAAAAVFSIQSELNGTFTSGLNPRTADLPINILSDTVLNEGNETFVVKIKEPVRGHIESGSGQGIGTITEPSFDFVSNCPAEFLVPKGGTRSMTCSVDLSGAVNLNNIQWSCENAPSVQCTFQPSGSSAILVQVQPAAGMAVGDFPNFTIRGTFSARTRSEVVNLHVVDFQPVCPDPITVMKGQSTDVACSVGKSSNWNDPTLQVSWSCSALPYQASCTFTPNPWTASNGPNVNLHIQTTGNTPGGNHNILVSGISSSLTRNDAVLLKVVTQTTYTFYPVGDTFLTGYEQMNSSNGLATNLRIQHPPRFSHLLLKFSQSDLVNTIGTKQILSANLKLYIETNFNNWGSGSNVNAHRMNADWQEYIVGSPAQGATWNCAVDTNLGNTNPNCAVQWNGGTYDANVLASVLHQNSQTGWKIFDVKSDV